MPKSLQGEEKKSARGEGGETQMALQPLCLRDSSKREWSMWRHKMPHVEGLGRFSKVVETGVRMGLNPWSSLTKPVQNFTH